MAIFGFNSPRTVGQGDSGGLVARSSHRILGARRTPGIGGVSASPTLVRRERQADRRTAPARLCHAFRNEAGDVSIQDRLFTLSDARSTEHLCVMDATADPDVCLKLVDGIRDELQWQG